MQVLLRNPLADPYVLGISGGAAVGALAAMTLGLVSWMVDGAAFVGALSAMALVFGLSRGDGAWTQTRLLLTGVIVAAGCGAVVSMMLALAPDTRVQSMLFWLMGDASGASWPWPALALLALGLLVAMPFRASSTCWRAASSAPGRWACRSSGCGCWSMCWPRCSLRCR